MKRLLISTLITAAGLWVVDLILPAITLKAYAGNTIWHSIASYLLVGLIFSLVSTIITPIIKIVAFPLYLLTFGLISVVINGAMFLFVSWLSAQFADKNLVVQGFSEGLYVESLGWAMLASILLSIFSVIARTITRTKR